MKEIPNIKNDFPDSDLDERAQNYLRIHKRRYAYLLSIVQQIRKKISEDAIRILDIGPSIFTNLLKENFPKDSILALGLDNEQSRGGHLPMQIQLNEGQFFRFNLNDAQFREKWIQIPPCDLVIMAEVLEHLYTAPTLVLKFLHTYIKASGYLIIQTPNAASLKNRLSLLFGKNPFEMIRENAENPGHFREYTTKELIKIAGKTGFEISHFECKSYFNPRNRFEKIYMSTTNFLPETFRDGITMVLRKI